MLRRCILVVLLLLSAAELADAQEACPWLTEGTAAALMGGDVSATMHVSGGMGTCDFILDRKSGDAVRMDIAVSHRSANECVQGERLPGVGQDAFACRTNTGGEHREVIRGRVRGMFFLLTLTTTDTRSIDEALWSKRLEQAAEAVAGSLF